jgi:hypothetical protein
MGFSTIPGCDIKLLMRICQVNTVRERILKQHEHPDMFNTVLSHPDAWFYPYKAFFMV